VVVALLVLQSQLDEQGEDLGVVGALEGLDPEWRRCHPAIQAHWGVRRMREPWSIRS
jgi:hypothetical protein